MKLYQKALSYVTLGVVSVGMGFGILGICCTPKVEENLEMIIDMTGEIEREKKEVNYISGKVKSEHRVVQAGSSGTKYFIYSFGLETEDKKVITFRSIRDQRRDIHNLDDRLGVGDKVKIRLTSSQLKPKILEDLTGDCIYDNISLDQIVEVNGENLEQTESKKKEVNYISGKIESEYTFVLTRGETNDTKRRYWIYSFTLKTADKKDITFSYMKDRYSYIDDSLNVGDKVKIRLTSSQLKPEVLEDLAGECGYDFSLTQIVEVNGEKFK